MLVSSRATKGQEVRRRMLVLVVVVSVYVKCIPYLLVGGLSFHKYDGVIFHFLHPLFPLPLHNFSFSNQEFSTHTFLPPNYHHHHHHDQHSRGLYVTQVARKRRRKRDRQTLPEKGAADTCYEGWFSLTSKRKKMDREHERVNRTHPVNSQDLRQSHTHIILEPHFHTIIFSLPFEP